MNPLHEVFNRLDNKKVLPCGVTERQRARLLIMSVCGIKRMTLNRWLKSPQKILQSDRLVISMILNTNLETLFKKNKNG